VTVRLRDVLLTAVVLLTASGLVLASALTDLRSPERTAALGATLADDADVQDAVVGAVVDALIDDATRRSPLVAALATPLRGLLSATVGAAIDTPAGREVLGTALTDALRQLTLPGPVVIDLRDAVLAIAQDAPPPLDGFARLAVEQGGVGLLVLGDDVDVRASDDTALLPPSDAALRRIGGLPAGVALGLLAFALALTVLLLVGPKGHGRAGRVGAAGVALLVVGAATLLVAGPVATTLTSGALGGVTEDAGFAQALPTLLDGVVGLLGRTLVLARTLTVLGIVGFVSMLALRPGDVR
jgi:hypothetical protein